ncbi:MAG TPA: glycosyl hydrolase 53 family protein, partial [Flavisolibacter sp.]|nr:glycosyl hydrolase 53 family protein [Flavisolibacter sp.]
MRRSIQSICRTVLFAGILVGATVSCSKSGGPAGQPVPPESPRAKNDSFYFGADLSYVNQILDKGGLYKENGASVSPFKIFKDHKANLVRVR